MWNYFDVEWSMYLFKHYVIRPENNIIVCVLILNGHDIGFCTIDKEIWNDIVIQQEISLLLISLNLISLAEYHSNINTFVVIVDKIFTYACNTMLQKLFYEIIIK